MQKADAKLGKGHVLGEGSNQTTSFKPGEQKAKFFGSDSDTLYNPDFEDHLQQNARL